MKTKIISEECEWQWVLVTTSQSVAVNYPSDGLLPEYSQKLQGLPSGNYYSIDGANHLEVRDMSNSSQGDITYDTFYDIFNRSDIFGIEERPQ
jgi:hypothetical protein